MGHFTNPDSPRGTRSLVPAAPSLARSIQKSSGAGGSAGQPRRGGQPGKRIAHEPADFLRASSSDWGQAAAHRSCRPKRRRAAASESRHARKRPPRRVAADPKSLEETRRKSGAPSGSRSTSGLAPSARTASSLATGRLRPRAPHRSACGPLIHPRGSSPAPRAALRQAHRPVESRSHGRITALFVLSSPPGPGESEPHREAL